MQNQSQRLCSMWHLVELLSSPLLPVFLPRRQWFGGVVSSWICGGEVVVNRFSETYCFYLFLMIIPLIRGADRNHGELNAFILLIPYMANIIPVLSCRLDPQLQLGSWTDQLGPTCSPRGQFPVQCTGPFILIKSQHGRSYPVVRKLPLLKSIRD